MLPLILFALWLAAPSGASPNPPSETGDAFLAATVTPIAATLEGRGLEVGGSEGVPNTDGPICIPFIGCF
jgi:hypothetical protein